MRRPHVYERSAPRSSRSPYQEPVVKSPSAVKDIATTLAALLAKTEAIGLSKLAMLVHAALQEAELQVGNLALSPARIADPADEVEPEGSDVEGLLRVLGGPVVPASPDT